MARHSTKQFVDEQIVANAVPTVSGRHDSIGLKHNGRWTVLVGADGKLTEAGKYYELQSNTKLAAGGFDYAQTPERVGDTEYIKMRNGKRAVTRRYSGGDWEFTTVGNKYYSQLHRNYIVKVPVVVSAEGQPDRKTNIPISLLGISWPRLALNKTEKERWKMARDMVSQYLSEDGLLMDDSGDKMRFDPNGNWDIMEETVGRDPDQRSAEVHVSRLVAPTKPTPIKFGNRGLKPVIVAGVDIKMKGEATGMQHRRTRSNPVKSCQFPFSSQILSAAFEDHKD